jgi:hypothetical protein
MDDREQREIEYWRKFLISAGRFAAVTPPAITLSTSLTDAIARSGAGKREWPSITTITMHDGMATTS